MIDSSTARELRAARDSRSDRVSGSQHASQLVAIYACVTQDARQRAALQLAVQWDDERGHALGMLQAHMAAALTTATHPSLARALTSSAPERTGSRSLTPRPAAYGG
jgi:hypothetical protein